MLFIGTKLVKSRPMTRLEYNLYREWELPANENGTDEGYLVEYMDGGKPNHPAHHGYISWSPKAQFDNAYRPSNAMTFGMALEALKQGHKVARSGWNGKGMWLSLSGPVEGRVISPELFWSKNNRDWAEKRGGALVLPCITMKTIDSSGREGILMGWLASQTDILAEDWEIVL